MSNERDRDELTERLIRRVLARPATGSATDACLDPETIAAWSERGLDAASAARAEAHLSSCATCQVVLATFVSTELQPLDSAALATVPFWQRWSLRWAIPALAGASAVLLWSLLRVPAPEDAAVDMAMAPPAAAPTTAAPAPPSAPQPESALASTDTSAKAVEVPRAFRADAGPAEARRVAPPPPVAMPAPQAAASNAAPPAAAPPSALPAPSVAEADTRVRDQPVFQAQSGERSFAISASAERASGVALNLGAPTTVVFEFGITPTPGLALGAVADSSRSEVVAPRGAGRGGAGGRAGAAAMAVAPPTPMPVRWRGMSNGVVDRLVAGSTTWESVAIEPGLALSAGAAPSSLVCWFVGRGGVVLRATDGHTFTRVSAPTLADLTSVVATSATEARVTAADGRTFTTTDGGVTWR